MQIQCRTIFDITKTGVTGHFRPAQLPFRDRSGRNIIDIVTWTRSRNQQRNWETINQLLQLRTQIFDLSDPKEENGYWIFDFKVEFEGVFGTGNDPYGVLKQDCDGVPMLIGLGEEYALTPVLTPEGSQQNIWFETISVNN